MPNSGDDDKLSALQGEVHELAKAVAGISEHAQANRAQRDGILMSEIKELKGAVAAVVANPTQQIMPVRTWFSGLKEGIGILMAIAGVAGILVVAGQTWQKTSGDIDNLASQMTRMSQNIQEGRERLAQEAKDSRERLESEMRMRLESQRAEWQQADAIMRQQQQASSDQIRLLHTTDQAANERMAQVYQSLATITVQNQNLAERMSEIGRRQDRLEARLGLSRGTPSGPAAMAPEDRL